MLPRGLKGILIGPTSCLQNRQTTVQIRFPVGYKYLATIRNLPVFTIFEMFQKLFGIKRSKKNVLELKILLKTEFEK